MPQLNIKGLSIEEVSSISNDLLTDLVEIIKCPRDHIMIDIYNVRSVFDGEEVKTYPFIEVAWFNRGQDIQDKVALVITNHVLKLVDEVEIAFKEFEKIKYYTNGTHYELVSLKRSIK
ncbi:DUF1904 family protein [Mycoplasmatota bacterium WC44]